MKKLYSLRSVLIIFTVVLLVVSFKAICDDDANSDILCDNSVFSSYASPVLNPVCHNGVFYAKNNGPAYPEPLISYLASKEKSPPPAILKTVS
ncbi:MAG: hypothetical protein NT088_02170 [Candidatus Omnitrophica bacterium]|nr:hypothetical protein [Candidatus Omnitrophota bacterium]